MSKNSGSRKQRKTSINSSLIPGRCPVTYPHTFYCGWNDATVRSVQENSTTLIADLIIKKMPGPVRCEPPGGTILFLPNKINSAPVFPENRTNQIFLEIFHVIIKAYLPYLPTIAGQGPGTSGPGSGKDHTGIDEKRTAYERSRFGQKFRGRTCQGFALIPRKCPGIALKKFIQTRQYAIRTNQTGTTRPGSWRRP